MKTLSIRLEELCRQLICKLNTGSEEDDMIAKLNEMISKGEYDSFVSPQGDSLTHSFLTAKQLFPRFFTFFYAIFKF